MASSARRRHPRLAEPRHATFSPEHVVSHRRRPLCTYLGDADPLHATGQAADDDGGYCYRHLILPPGQIVTRRADALAGT